MHEVSITGSDVIQFVAIMNRWIEIKDAASGGGFFPRLAVITATERDIDG